MPVRSYRLICSLFALMLVLSSCGTDNGDTSTTTVPPASSAEGTDEQATSTQAPAAPAESLLIVATTTILGDVVANLVGSDAEVVVLLPVGADPHDYRASSAQVALLNDADLVVANGLGLEEGLIDVLESVEADGVNVLEVGEFLDPIEFGEAGHDHEDEHGDHDEGDHEDEHGHDDEGDHEDEHGHEGHVHTGADPHFWFDPLRVAEAAKLIADELAAVDPSIEWAARAAAYVSELEALDSEIQSILAGIPPGDRKLVTNHDALGYFAARYGFEIVDTVIPGGATLADPSSAELAALVETMRDEGVTVIFAETIESSDLAEAVAAEVGSSVAVVELYTGSLGEPGSGADTLTGMLRVNAQRIADAL